MLLGLELRGGRLVIPAQMDITQARQSGAARGGGGGRGRAGGGEALHPLVLLLLHPPVLEPNLDLPLVQVEQAGHLHAPRFAQVAAEVELLLQLHQLRARVRGARPLGGRGRAWTLLFDAGALCGDRKINVELVVMTKRFVFLFYFINDFQIILSFFLCLQSLSLLLIYCQFAVVLLDSVVQKACMIHQVK